MSQQPRLTHPLVAAYLDDLDRALAGADPRERADVVAGVREHLDDALTPDAGGAAVQRVLADLGPVEAIAAQVTAAPLAPGPTPPARGGDWISAGSLAASVVAAFLLFIPFVAVPAALATLVLGAAHLRSPGAHRGRCWATIAVSATTLLVTVLLALLLLPASETVTMDGPVAG